MKIVNLTTAVIVSFLLLLGINEAKAYGGPATTGPSSYLSQISASKFYITLLVIDQSS